MTYSSGLKSLFRPPVVVVLVFVAMLLVSWRRWNSLIVDFGRETDLPFRLLNGEMLYRDVHYIYSPFSPYFNALLYGVFGVHIDTLIVSGIVCSGIIAFLCYRICRNLMPPTESAIGTSMVIVLCIFKPAGNLILPYSFSALHGTVFALATALFLLRYAAGRNRRDLILAGVFIGLASIAKLEFGFAGAVTATVYLVYINRTNLSKLITDLAAAAVPAIAIAGPVFALLFANIDARTLIEDCHLFYTNLRESVIVYNRFRSGMNAPLFSVFQMFGAVGVSVALVSLIVFLSDKTGRLRRRSLMYFTVAVIITAVVLYLSIGQWDGSPLRALPFLLSGMICISWRRRSDDGSVAGLAPDILFIAALFALAMLGRVLLRVPSGGFSGSFFLPVSICLIIYALVCELPAYIKKWTDNESSFIRAKQITRTFCAVVIVGSMISFGYRFRLKYVHEIIAPRGTLFVEKATGPVIAETLKFIETATAPGDFISVVPEGNDLAFLTGRRINMRHQVLIPDFLSEVGEQASIEAFKRDSVRYIFVPNRPMREFGKVAFAKDYNKTLGTWIEANYRPIKTFGVPDGTEVEIGDPRFFIKVYEIKE